MFRAHRTLLEVEFSCTCVTTWPGAAQSSEIMGKELGIAGSLLQEFHEKKPTRISPKDGPGSHSSDVLMESVSQPL